MPTPLRKVSVEEIGRFITEKQREDDKRKELVQERVQRQALVLKVTGSFTKPLFVIFSSKSYILPIPLFSIITIFWMTP